MSKQAMSFLIPLEVLSQNKTDRMHWAARGRMLRMWQGQLAARMRPGTLDYARGKRRMTITAWRKRLITDRANMIGGCKLVVDAVVRAGLLVDDNDAMAEIHYIQEALRESPLTGNPCTMIDLEDM